MRDDQDDNYVSVGQWMLLILLPSIPVFGWILVIVLAFSGRNQTRKNYFRAWIAWILLAVVVLILIGLLLGAFPALFQAVKGWAKHQ
jgi:Na+-driven multidrug efflux pump